MLKYDLDKGGLQGWKSCSQIQLLVAAVAENLNHPSHLSRAVFHPGLLTTGALTADRAKDTDMDQDTGSCSVDNVEDA